ncbi:hypothetical protein D3C87_1339510 [compost metagenome]
MPTLVMIANIAATGALAEEYAGTSQKFSGHIPALARNATARIPAPACSNPRSASGTSGIFSARSAMFRVPVTP